MMLQKKNLIIILGAIITFVFYAYLGLLIFKNESQSGNAAIVNFQEYKNSQFGFSLFLPSDWTHEELPIFIEGVMTYDGRNLSFKSSDGSKGFGIIIKDNIDNYETAEDYVNDLLEENRRLYKVQEVPYIWDYSSKEKVEFNLLVGDVIKDLFGPGGHKDIIYLVNSNYIFEISYSKLSEEGIDIVDDKLRQEIIEILNTFTINTTNELAQNGSIDTSNWAQSPYYSDYLNFLVYYPSDWDIIDIYDPRDLYEGHPLVWFGADENFYSGTNVLGVFYYNDTGEDLDTWVGKRSQVLQSDKGYAPITKELKKQNKRFIELCFLGHPDYSPMQTCFIYMQSTPYIIELKAEGFSRDFQADKYSQAFFSKFTLLNKPDQRWKIHKSPNVGFQIDYPEDKYPPNPEQDIAGVSVSFTKDFIGQFMIVSRITDYEGGIEAYWFNKVRGLEKDPINLPLEIYLDQKKCFMADLSGTYYEGVANTLEFYCQGDNQIYEFILNPDEDKELDRDFFIMLSTLQFL